MDNTKIKQIAELRKKVSDLGVDVSDLRLEMEMTEEGEKFVMALDAHKEIKEELAKLELDYKAKCVDEYKLTNDKDQLGGAIKIFTTYDVLEESVLSYAIHHSLPHLLKPNMSEFKKFAKIVPLGFVTVIETPKMTLATNLSEFLEE